MLMGDSYGKILNPRVRREGTRRMNSSVIPAKAGMTKKGQFAPINRQGVSPRISTGASHMTRRDAPVINSTNILSYYIIGV